jgi:predicted enzyme related to lactoylglutathione lyase
MENQEHKSESPNIGWKPVPVENLPSQGKFYSHGTTVEIRPVQMQEIRTKK